jgi:hypothetical protein
MVEINITVLRDVSVHSGRSVQFLFAKPVVFNLSVVNRVIAGSSKMFTHIYLNYTTSQHRRMFVTVSVAGPWQ